jgi:hypothetical protein
MTRILPSIVIGVIIFSSNVGSSTLIDTRTTNHPLFSSTGPHEEWNKTFGGLYPDEGWVIHQTSDGGFILAGYTESYGSGNSDIWLIKTDADGKKIFDKTFGGSNSDFARSVQQTTDGGYIIGGSTKSYGNGNYDFYVIKTDTGGNLEWQKTFGGNNEDHCQAILQLSNGNYILTGDWDLGGASDCCLMEIDTEGNELWSKFFSSEYYGFSVDMKITSDGAYIISGTIDFSGKSNMWLFKTNATGDLIWQKTFGMAVDVISTSVHLTSDQGCLIGGWTVPSDLRRSMVIVKTDENGNLQWDKCFPNGLSTKPYVNTLGIEQTTDGGYILAGQKIVSGDTDAWILRTDTNGTVLWNKTLRGSSDDYCCGIQQIDDEHFILVGATSSYGAGQYNVWLIKFSQGCETLPPLKPDLDGPTAGRVNKPYTYTSQTSDPDEDQVYYLWDWGDGNTSGWLGPFESGASVSLTHVWTMKGVYSIKVKARDSFGAESPWSDPLPITMPYIQERPLVKVLEFLLQRFPHAFPLLRNLFE